MCDLRELNFYMQVHIGTFVSNFILYAAQLKFLLCYSAINISKEVTNHCFPIEIIFFKYLNFLKRVEYFEYFFILVSHSLYQKELYCVK